MREAFVNAHRVVGHGLEMSAGTHQIPLTDRGVGTQWIDVTHGVHCGTGDPAYHARRDPAEPNSNASYLTDGQDHVAWHRGLDIIGVEVVEHRPSGFEAAARFKVVEGKNRVWLVRLVAYLSAAR